MSDENTTPDLHLYMDAILRRFRPSDAEDATHFFTTAEVCDAIRVLNPEIKGLALAVVHDGGGIPPRLSARYAEPGFQVDDGGKIVHSLYDHERHDKARVHTSHSR